MPLAFRFKIGVSYIYWLLFLNHKISFGEQFMSSSWSLAHNCTSYTFMTIWDSCVSIELHTCTIEHVNLVQSAEIYSRQIDDLSYLLVYFS